MKEPKNKQKLLSQCCSLFKQNFSTCLSYLAILAFGILSSLFLAFYVIESLILTVPFIIAPLTFAAFMGTSYNINEDKTFSFSNLWKYIKMYFTPLFNGCFGLLKSFLLAFLTALIVSFIINVVGFIFVDDDVINSIFHLSFSLNADIDAILEEILNNESFQLLTLIDVGISSLMFLIVFINLCMYKTFAIYIIYFIKFPIPFRMFKKAHKLNFKGIQKDFNKDFYAHTWWINIILVLSYLLGWYLAFINFENSIDFSYVYPIFGAALMVIVSIWLLPLLSNLMYLLYEKYGNKYVEYGIKQSQAEAKSLLSSDNFIDPTQKKDIEKFLEKTNEALKDIEEKNKNDNESSNKEK